MNIAPGSERTTAEPARTTPNPESLRPDQALHELHRLLTNAGLDRMLLGHQRGVSVLSINSELTVWSFDGRITWRHSNTDRHAPVEIHPASDPQGAANRILAHLGFEEAPAAEEPATPHAPTTAEGSSPHLKAATTPTDTGTGKSATSHPQGFWPGIPADAAKTDPPWPVTSRTLTLPYVRRARSEHDSAQGSEPHEPRAATPPHPVGNPLSAQAA